MIDSVTLRKMHRPVHNGDDFSRIHPKMKRGNRAKIFAPFDALSGFGETMDAETVYTVHPAELSEEMKQELDEKLQNLLERYIMLPARRCERVSKLQISVLYFEIDSGQTVLKNDGILLHYPILLSQHDGFL
ncbi:MAG: hypothetical protein MR488_10990 [Lachnospiraceae bacterium]|nr:hypothetical protein [Lachnospiraceae bacterium]